jgi:Zn-dependent protease
MGDSLRLGRVAGIPVGVHWSVVGMGLVVAAVLALAVLPVAFPGYGLTDRWVAAAAGAVVFGLSLLAHELAHAVAARRYGVAVDGITLWLLGGVARLARQAPSPRAEAGIALAGPAASAAIGVALVAGVLVAADGGTSRLGLAVLLWVGMVNLVLAVFNLLPAAPLDGGRVLAAVLWRRSGDAEGARLVAGRLGLGFGALLVVLGAAEILVWGRLTGVATAAVGVFLVGAARGEIAGAVVRGRLHQVTMAALMRAHPPAVPDWLTVDRLLEWAGPHGEGLVFPVVRWDHEPVGWVTPNDARSRPAAERSWTRVERVMVPDRAVPRAWGDEPVDDVLARLGNDLPPSVVVLDPRTGRVIGTVGAAQLGELYRPPDLWGRTPDSAGPASLAR